MTRSRESSRSDTPRVDVARLPKPMYVNVTEKMTSPCGWRVYLSQWIARVTINQEDVLDGRPARVHWNMAMSAAYNRVRERDDTLVPLSITVFEQQAARMPIDVAVTPLFATRPYIIRQREHVVDMNCEVMRPGQAYLQHVCSIAFCSMHALGFDRSVVEDFIDGEGVILVPKTYRYAELIRQVVMARQLERMEPLQRRCATAASLTDAPLELTSVWRYDDPMVFQDAIEYIDSVVAEPTRLRLAEPYQVTAEAATGRPWSEALSPHVGRRRTEFEATVRFGVFFCRVPRWRR